MVDRQVDLLREKRVRIVELGQEGFQEGGGVDLLGLLEEEVPAVLEDSPPDDEDDHRHVRPRLEEAEHVDVLAPHGLHDLAFGHVPDRPERVPIRAGHLEVLLGGCGLHSPLEARLELLVLPLRNSTTSATASP